MKICYKKAEEFRTNLRNKFIGKKRTIEKIKIIYG